MMTPGGHMTPYLTLTFNYVLFCLFTCFVLFQSLHLKAPELTVSHDDMYIAFHLTLPCLASPHHRLCHRALCP